MKRGVLFSVFLICLASCEAENIEEELFTGETLAEDLSEEYIYLSLNGEHHEIVDPEYIFAEVQKSPDTEAISFVLNGKLPPEDNLIFNLVLFYYDGPGTYYTGRGNSLSQSILTWEGEDWICNSLTYGPGRVIITLAEEEFIEGSFKIRGYNPELKSYVLQKGNFRVKWEQFTY